MSDILRWGIILLGGYLLGNFQSGIIITGLFGRIDIRKYGSGGSGSTNVARIMGALPGVITLILDAAKGVLGAWIGSLLLGDLGMMAMGAAVIVGHNWPIFYRFRGGKGIAASLGVLFFVEPYLALGLFAGAAVIILITRYVSLASLACFALGFVYFLVFEWGNWAVIGFWLAMFLMALYAHRENIRRLRNGTENRLSFGKGKPA